MQILKSGHLKILIACASIILLGVVITALLISQRTPPAHTPIVERPLRVQAEMVRFEDARVDITGYGNAASYARHHRDTY